MFSLTVAGLLRQSGFGQDQCVVKIEQHTGVHHAGQAA
jgi:hypothetical protein